MEKRKREILALGLLVLLGIGIASGMAWYMLVGHNWNKAASHIDDLVGSMDGYTVVVFEGVLLPAKGGHSASGSGGLTSASSSASAKHPSISSALSGASPSTSAVSATASSGLVASSAATASATSASPASASRAESSGASSSQSDSAPSRKKQLTLKDVVASYREKGATVITLHLNDLARYGDPLVAMKDGRRYGICASRGKYRYVDVRDKLLELDDAAADFKFVISDSATIKKSWLKNVDLVVLACAGRLGGGGEYIDGTFFIESPHIGEMQAVIISPSGTITSKTISKL